MKRNNKGFSSGLMLVVILLVIVIVALLFTAQMGAFGMGKTGDGPAQTPDPVEQAQEAVDAVNERIEQYAGMAEP
ncbi:MAG: hypothetical protein IKN89_12030 [Oscillospiraceae bacterium]|jgi:flagellar basal body-associated protein FliL|nr:hypothetical protein [Oscillospiraceae bacterium]